MIAAIRNLANRTALVSSIAGAAIMLLYAVLTGVDIVMRNFFHGGILGMVDLTQLAMVWAAALTIPLGFADNSHISVDLVAANLPAPLTKAVNILAALCAVFVLYFCIRWGWAEAARQIGYGDSSMTIGIPVIWYWVPLIFGFALSAVCALTSMTAPPDDRIDGL